MSSRPGTGLGDGRAEALDKHESQIYIGAMDTPWLLVALTLFYAFLFWRAWTTGEIGGKSVYRKITRTERPQIFYMLCFIYAVLGIACAVFATFAFREGSLQNVISNFA